MLTAAEYRQGSSVFRDKIRSLETQYGSMRRTRGDGNCFFRSFMFAFMEQLVQNNDLSERNRCAWHLPRTVRSSSYIEDRF